MRALIFACRRVNFGAFPPYALVLRADVGALCDCDKPLIFVSRHVAGTPHMQVVPGYRDRCASRGMQMASSGIAHADFPGQISKCTGSPEYEIEDTIEW